MKKIQEYKTEVLNTLWRRTKGLIEIKNYRKKWGYFESKREETRKPTKDQFRIAVVDQINCFRSVDKISY